MIRCMAISKDQELHQEEPVIPELKNIIIWIVDDLKSEIFLQRVNLKNSTIISEKYNKRETYCKSV